MPFIKKIFDIQTPTKAFVFVQKILHCSNKEAQKIIDKQRLRFLDDMPIKKSDILLGKVCLEVFEAQKIIAPFFIHKDFALYHKPHNLLTHPKGRFSHQSLCDSIKGYFGRDANPAHRLDFETAGILLASTNKSSEITLKRLFEENKVKKIYLGIVKGQITQDRIIDLPILHPNRKNKKMDLGIKSQIHPLGKEAITHIKVLQHFADSTLLQITPLTGRTHQIRLHLASINHPIIGEPLYGVEDTQARKYLQNKLSSQNILKLQAKSLAFCYQDVRYFFSTPSML